MADILDNLTAWVIQHHELCRPNDILSLFLTLATLNYPTFLADELKSKLIANFTETSFLKSNEWLNFVWALTILDFVEPHHIESVLKYDQITFKILIIGIRKIFLIAKFSNEFSGRISLKNL